MARYGEAFRNRAVARLLPPESANVGLVAKEIGVSPLAGQTPPLLATSIPPPHDRMTAL